MIEEIKNPHWLPHIFDPCNLHGRTYCTVQCRNHPVNQVGAAINKRALRARPKPLCDDVRNPMTTTDDSNPKDLIGLTKVPLRLIPGPALVAGAIVLGLGAKKYGPYNWREKKVRYTVYVEAAQRHLLSALDGEEIDPESGEPHTAHAMACMMILLDAKATGNLIDDRPIPGVTARLIAEHQTKAKT